MGALTFLLTLVVALTPLAIDMYLPAMPTIATDLNVPLATIQGSLSTFLIGFACGQLIHGPLSDSLGRKPVLMAGLFLFVVASLLAALAVDANAFLGWRIIQALGGAAGSVVTNAIITDSFQGAKAIKIRSTMMTVMLLAPLLAPTLGAHLLVQWGWRSIYWVLAGSGLITLIWVGHAIPKQQQTSSLKPSVLLGRYKTILSHKAAWLWLPGMALSSAPLFAFLAGTPYLYIEYFKVSPQTYGILFGVNACTMAAGALLNIKLAGRVAPTRVIRRVQSLQSVALLLLLILVLTNQLTLVGSVVLFACSVGVNSLVFPNGNQLVMEMFPTHAGTAGALLGASQFAIGALVSSLVALGSNHGPTMMITVMTTAGLLSFLFINLAIRQHIPK